MMNREPGRPGIHREAPQTPHLPYPLPVDDLEREPEFRFEFVLPLDRHRRRGRDDDEIDPTPQQQLARDKPRLDRLAEPNIVRDQEVDAGEAQRLAERQKLIGVEPNARPKRRLQEIAVSGCRRSPSYGAKVRGQNFRAVRKPRSDISPSVFVEHGRADLGVPKHFEALSLGIVGDAGEAEGLQVVRFAAHFLDEPRSPAKLDETSLFDGRSHSSLHHLSRFSGVSLFVLSRMAPVRSSYSSTAPRISVYPCLSG